MANLLKQIADERLIDKDDIEYIPTGIRQLDERLEGGIPCGFLTVLSSSEGSGKTTLTTQMVGYAADKGYKAMIYSGEMSGGVTLNTMIRQIAGPRWTTNKLVVDGDEPKTAPYVPNEVEAYIRENVLRDKVYFCGGDVIKTWSDLQCAMEAAHKVGVKLYVIDNLMTLTALFGGDKNNSHYETDQYYQQTGAVEALNAFAIEKGVAVVLVAHTKKGGNSYGDDGNDGIFGTSAVKNLAGLVIRFLAPTPSEMTRFLKEEKKTPPYKEEKKKANTKNAGDKEAAKEGDKEDDKEAAKLPPYNPEDRILMITKNRIGGKRDKFILRYQSEYYRYFDDTMQADPGQFPNVFDRITRKGYDFGMFWEAGFYKLIADEMRAAGCTGKIKDTDAAVEGVIKYYEIKRRQKAERQTAKNSQSSRVRRKSAFELYATKGMEMASSAEKEAVKQIETDEYGKIKF